jgi:ketol-acid reductoisomerase
VHLVPSQPRRYAPHRPRLTRCSPTLPLPSRPHPPSRCNTPHFAPTSYANSLQGTRGVKTLDFAGTKEVVYERSDWPLAKLQDYFKNDTLALIGYGSQGHGQGLNARDNGLNVIVGVRKDGESWRQAVEDGWVGVFFLLLLNFFF